MGNVTEIMYQDKINKSCTIRKLDNENYLDLRTGEVKQFEHIENRSEDKNSIRQSLTRGRDLLNTNITDVSRCRWVTLTYAENMTDTKRLETDYNLFIRRLRYKIGKFEYIVFREPQGRGAWHCHLVMIFEGKAPYIANNLMAEIWGHGFVTVKRLDDVDNVGAYLTAYLGDMEVTEAEKENIPIKGIIKEVEFKDENGQTLKKRYIKGARLNLYPPKFNIYCYSKGIKKPLTTYQRHEEAIKEVNAGTLTSERTIQLLDDDSDFEKVINYRYYNKLRKKMQNDNNSEEM